MICTGNAPSDGGLVVISARGEAGVYSVCA